MDHLSRRGFLAMGGGVAVFGAGATSWRRRPVRGGSETAEATAYYQALLRHTRWVETLWNEAIGHYPVTDFNFVNVLGNAVLLEFGTYDAALAGVPADTLRDHTVRTIEHFAATNFHAAGVPWGSPGYEWGGRIYWDATMESYFVAAARLLWSDLTPTARADVDKISIGGAQYMAGLAATEDPRSGGWSSNALQGGFRGDSKIEEMGAKSMPLATGLAYHPTHPDAPAWREWLTRWMSNLSGLPATDETDETLLEGRPVREWNEAKNLFDTYLVENHGSFAPMYQQSVGAYPGRNAIHFLIAGQPLPDVFGYQPNSAGLWRTLTQVGTRAGLTAHPMIADRHHLYGRDVLPIAWRRMGEGDRVAARGERMLIEHLEPYQAYPPTDRLTKFSGEPKYEPEARAEVAMAYLLHYWRAQLNGDVPPVETAEYWSTVSGTADHGAEAGLLSHQTPNAVAMAVTKPSFVKFAFLPEHDDWLFDATGTAPAFLPSTSLAATARRVARYTRAAAGFDATATVLRFASGIAGFATLPNGEVVYASSGVGAGEGAFRLYALTMPGVEGLDGTRRFHGPSGSVTLAPGGGDGGVDEHAFTAVTARHVRMLGRRPATQYGYSLWALEVYGAGGADLARGKATTASSYDPSFQPSFATDGSATTRWAVSRTDRPRPDSWLAVDLGSSQQVARVKLAWETAYGAEYRVQVSPDGANWEDVVTVPPAHTFNGGWVNVDDRAGFVVRGSHPIRVTATAMTLADGPAAPLVAEGYPAQSAAATRAAAATPVPTTDQPGVVASTAGGLLSVFNLTTAAVTATVQTTTGAATVTLDAASAVVRPLP